MAQQVRNPTGDGTFTGTWTGTAGSRHTLVSDHPDATGASKLTHGTTAGRGSFTFTAFDVPAGSTIQSVQVLYYDQKTGSQAASWGAYLRVGGADRATNDAHNPANGTWILRTATYTTNPATGAAWTAAQVNGAAASNNLEQFGLVATDANPTCEVASIQLVVNYTEPQNRAQVYFAEMEVPTAPRRALVTFAEFQVPDIPTNDRRVHVTFAELETPNAARRALVTFAEFELPDAPLADRRAIVTFAELQIPDVSGEPPGEAPIGTVPVRYIVGEIANVVPVETVSEHAAGVVPVREVEGTANIVPVRETNTETPRVKVRKV